MVEIGRYNLHLTGRLFNLRDGYPPFHLETEDEGITFDMPYVEKIGRGRLIVRTLFGGFMLFPHIFIVIFRIYGVMFVNIPGNIDYFNLGTTIAQFTVSLPIELHNRRARSFDAGQTDLQVSATIRVTSFCLNVAERTGKHMHGHIVPTRLSSQLYRRERNGHVMRAPHQACLAQARNRHEGVFVIDR